MKAETSLTRQSTATVICKNCKRELSLEFFYVNKTTQCPDKYCKECRKSLSRRQYISGKKLPSINLSGRIPYPVITQIGDRDTRIQLILNALRIVHLSMERKKKKVQEEEVLL
mgnify:CR=1 FL=1